MPRRHATITTNEIYHVYNRSIAKQEIFFQPSELKKAFEIVNFYRFPQKIKLSEFKKLNYDLKKDYILSLNKTTPLIEIYSFSFMPNHFHFLLKQIQEKGITQFISNFQNSFAKCFNLKNDRNGSLFQNRFKAKIIENDEQLLHTSRYIHINPVTAGLINFKKLLSYPWTSFPGYANKNTDTPFLNTEFILNFFPSNEKYIEFVSDQVDYQKNLATINNLILE
ncbi:MAG: hypothetical protein C4584_00555 [Armatimonadetes bacterium]|nr:MAG: hypothetical protein C4584_00555 [Armatimonadota bacterium]